MSDWEHEPTKPPRPWWAADADDEPPNFRAPAPPVDPTQPTPQTPADWPAQPPAASTPQTPPSWPPTPPPPGGSPGGAWDEQRPPGSWPAAPARPPAAKRVAASIAAIALVLASAGVGALVAVAVEHNPRSQSVTLPSIPTSPFTPPTGNGSGGSSSTSGALDANAVAAKVIPAIVNITTTTTQGRAAGTGMVISASGAVLTNNHVIADSTSIKVDIGGTGNSHAARVVGYNVADDVALLQIDGVSNLPTITFGNPSQVNIGDRVVAIGNALGRGGTPAVTQGKVTALDQQVTAGDPAGGTTETLHQMIQIDAPIQPGDSGGALVDAGGRVIGMNTAASGGRFRQQTGSNVGFAIPVDNAVTVVKQIQTGVGTDKVHIGANRALLGVRVSDVSTSTAAPASSGALVIGVEGSSAAGTAGIKTGDVVVSVDSKSIADQNGLHLALTRYQPHDKVQVGWIDSGGVQRSATVELGEGPPA